MFPSIHPIGRRFLQAAVDMWFQDHKKDIRHREVKWLDDLATQWRPRVSAAKRNYVTIKSHFDCGGI